MAGNLCCSCEIPFEELGMPLSTTHRKQTLCVEIRKLHNNASNENIARLSQMGYHPFHDGLVDLHFSDPKRGLHGATPAEILHMYHMGMEERSIECCFGSRKISKKPMSSSRKRKAVVLDESDSEDEQEMMDDSEDGEEEDEMAKETGKVVVNPIGTNNLSRLFVFSAEAKNRVNRMAKRLHDYLK
jgi:hypothetical protein